MDKELEPYIAAAVGSDPVRDTMAEYAQNMQFQLRGLPALGLKKVAEVAAYQALKCYQESEQK